MKIAVHGATGKMGRAIVRLAREVHGVDIVGAIAHADAPEQGRDIGDLAGVGPLGVVVTPDVSSGILGADVVIDFSIASAFPMIAKAAERAKIPLVSGTTGLGDDAKGVIEAVSRAIPILWAANMSFGVEVLSELVKQAALQLGPGFDIEIVEAHHRAKVDAPSGTAHRLAEAAREARADLVSRYGREGNIGARPKDEIGIFALRGGDVIGDHSVHFLGPGERIELTHRATSRDLFAHGALRAAKWIVGKAPRRYTIGDLVRASLS